MLTMADRTNPNNDFEIALPPDDTVSAMEFSPATSQKTFLIAGSWDKTVRCWEVQEIGQAIPNSMQSMTMPILDVCWSGDGTKVFIASCNKLVKCWDIVTNQMTQVAAHDAPVRTCHWFESTSYTCIMTGSWDKTLKFWDLRSERPITTINLPERVYCADVEYPFAVVGTESNDVITYRLDGTPSMLDRITSPLKYQNRCVAIFKDKTTQVCILGFGLGNIGGGTAIFSNFNPQKRKDVFSLNCHCRNILKIPHTRNVYAVNDIKFHPVHDTFATVGSNSTFAFWDKKSRKMLKISEVLDQSITKCCFNSDGQIFAYSSGYDWSKGPEYYDPNEKPRLFLRSCFEELKPK
ncbi:hypothetical protein ACI65C_006511 [Semiaphis heraclei]